MATVWHCALCSQRNPQTLSNCKTCGRPSGFIPSDAGAMPPPPLPPPAEPFTPDRDRVSQFSSERSPRASPSPSELAAPHTPLISPSSFAETSSSSAGPPRRSLQVHDGHVAVGYHADGSAQVSSAVAQAIVPNGSGLRQSFLMYGLAAVVAISPYFWPHTLSRLNVAWILCFIGCVLWQFTYILGHDEQIRISHIQGEEVVNGPCLKFCPPWKSAATIKALLLRPAEFVRLRNQLDLQIRTVTGPGKYFLLPNERVETEGQGLVINNSSQYVCVVNRLSGQRSIVTNPPHGIWIPNIAEEGQPCNAVPLGRGEYLLIQDTLSGEKFIHASPGLWFPTQCPYAIWEKRHAIPIGRNEYVRVKDTLTGQVRNCTEQGMWFPEHAYEEGAKETSIWLEIGDYVSVEDKSTGMTSIVRGPRFWVPGPYDVYKAGENITLSSTEYIIVTNRSTCATKVVKGPLKWVPGPYETPSEVKQALHLAATQYINVRNQMTGAVRMVKGPGNWFPSDPAESPSPISNAVALKHDEFVKLIDTATGKRWIHQGQSLLCLEATWKVDGSIHRSAPLSGREYMRLSVAPRFRITKNSSASPRRMHLGVERSHAGALPEPAAACGTVDTHAVADFHGRISRSPSGTEFMD